jgi:hypothetical protein
MRILYYDCFSGISGDMNLGAMLDLGVEKDYLAGELSKLNLDHEFEIRVSRDSRKGICGTKVDVVLRHHHEHHEHHEHHHEHRNLHSIESIINSSSLSGNVKRISLDMFGKVAEAEAKVHGKPLHEVHFHEVGALDSIVDIVGAAICLDRLGVDRVISSSVELGGGFVRCAHGLIPVPAPATVEILKGIPVKSGIVPFETTTPTGAAILASSVDEFSDVKDFVIERTGYGIGGRDTEIPNVLRVYLGEKNGASVAGSTEDEVCILECNIDDMNPELFECIAERLFALGALDVYRTPILMKKERLGILLSVMCCEEDKEKLKEAVFLETSTLGIREQLYRRTKLEREFDEVTTSYGRAAVKKAYYKGRLVGAKPEYEDCKRLAMGNDVPIRAVYGEAMRMIGELDDERR